jgi:hypothetical protein
MSIHSLPTEITCACCWDDINEKNYVEYKSSKDSDWLASGYCETCINQMLDTQWETYTNGLAKTTCKAEQRRLLTRGPPINLRDSKVLPCPDDGEVYSLWFMSDNNEHSARLKGSLIGEVIFKNTIII